MKKQKYLLALAAQNGHDSINTILTNIETGESREESWERVDGEWIWQNGWGEAKHGLYQVLKENGTRTDELLTEVEANAYGEVEFEA